MNELINPIYLDTLVYSMQISEFKKVKKDNKVSFIIKKDDIIKAIISGAIKPIRIEYEV